MVRMFTVTLSLGLVAFGGFPATALAESELLLRQHTRFHTCRITVQDLVGKLGARDEQLVLERDTGAHYQLKIVSEEANLVFRCNKVSRTLEVSRESQEPSELLAKGN